MTLNKNNLVLILIVIISASAVLLRLLPHLANFAPIGGLAIFAGLYATKKSWLLAPLAAMVLSDIFIGFDSWQMRLVVYGSFLVYVLIARVIKENKSILSVVGGTLAGGLVFYLTTNFAVWAFSGMYPHTLSGLIYCYEMALPFFRNSLMGDLFYVGAFVGAYELAYGLAVAKLKFAAQEVISA